MSTIRSFWRTEFAVNRVVSRNATSRAKTLGVVVQSWSSSVVILMQTAEALEELHLDTNQSMMRTRSLYPPQLLTGVNLSAWRVTQAF